MVLNVSALDLVGGLVTQREVSTPSEMRRISTWVVGILRLSTDIEFAVNVDHIALAERRSDDLHDTDP